MAENFADRENTLLLNSPKVKEDAISFVDINQSLDKFGSLYKQYKEENIVIAPLGTKLSTIPVAYLRGEKIMYLWSFLS